MMAGDPHRPTVLGAAMPHPERDARRGHPAHDPSSAPPPRHPPPPSSRPPRDSFWHRVPATWKAITVIAAFVGAGATTQGYFASYVKRSELEANLAGRAAQIERLQDQIRQLREADAAQGRDVESIKEMAAETRGDVKRLLQHMLENPPDRRERSR